MKTFAYTVISISIAFIFGICWYILFNKGETYRTLNSDWQVNVGGKLFKHESLPLSIEHLTKVNPGDKAIFSTEIETPKQCRNSSCYLFFGEIGDLAKIYVDGEFFRSQGYADHSKVMARYFPFWVQIPPEKKGKLSIRLEVESLYGLGFGLQDSNNFIGDYTAVRHLERSLVIQSTVFPLMQALLLFVLGLLILATNLMTSLPAPFLPFAIFCFASAAFSTSFSFIPREFLPITFVGFTHYTLKFLADLTLFELINSVVFIPRGLKLFARTGLSVFGLSILALFLARTNFQGYIEVVKIFSFVVVTVPAIGLFSAIRSWNQNRNLPLRRSLDFEILIPVFGVLTACELWDFSKFWNVVSGPYLMKFYLAPLAFMFALILARRLVRDQRRLARARAEAEKDALIGHIAIGLAHDLKSPLSALEMAAQFALDQNNEKYSHKIMPEIKKRSLSVTDKLDELLTYSREEIKERALVSLKNLITEVQAELAPILKSKSITLSLTGATILLNVDPESFKRVLTNLIVNAVDASTVGSFITVKGAHSDGRNIISVEDFGEGIAKQDLTRIFDPYFSKGKEKGTGLGLAIAFRIIKQHGGSLRVHSELNKGSSFIMEVPA